MLGRATDAEQVMFMLRRKRNRLFEQFRACLSEFSHPPIYFTPIVPNDRDAAIEGPDDQWLRCVP